MEVEKSKKSKYLFQIELERDQVEALVNLDPALLKNMLLRCSRTFQKYMSGGTAVNVFLKNYRMLIEAHSASQANSQSVDLCLHFTLLYSQYLILEGRESEAKAILKETEGYLQMEGVDKMLMGVCLNNLAQIYSRQGKMYKSLAIALKGINLIEWHLEALKVRRDRSSMIEDVIVFVNLLMVAQSVLRKILLCNPKTFFKSLFKIINRLGYSFANKYLGRESLFTKKFYLQEDSVLLPVYQEEEESVVLNQFEMRIAKELETIYAALRELNLEPEVYYIHEHMIETQSKTESEIVVEPEVVEPALEFSVCYEQNFEISGQQIDISLYRESTNLVVTSNGCEYIGHIQFKFRKGSKGKTETIPEEKFIKILNCINFNDILPYEVSLKTLSPNDFFKKGILHFLTVTEEGQVRIAPRAKPVLEPFERRFIGENAIIFVNHISFQAFRVAICLSESCESIYLDITFSNKSCYGWFKLTELESSSISKLQKNYGHSFNDYKGHLSFGKTKKIKMLNPKQFKLQIKDIIDRFQIFLTDEDVDIMEELTSAAPLDDSPKYYKYVEESEERGQFYELRYRQSANIIELFTVNSFKTYSPGGLTKVKGSASVHPQHFFRDFGVAIRPVRKWIPAFYNLIVQKFKLKIFEEPISQMEEDRYEENAVNEIQLVSKFFRRQFIQFEDYLLPLTVELISVGNQNPLGIKVTAYEPIKCVNVGIFIYVNFDYWQKLYNLDSQPDPNEAYMASASRSKRYRFQFQKTNFLTEWLVKEGFKKLLSRLVISNRSLEIRGMTGKFYRLEDLL